MPQSRQLIINADDFGLHPTVNKAVIAGYRKGCLTSTSLIINGDAWQEAVEFARENTGLGIGVHLTLVGEKPVTDPALIPSLVDNQGRFLGNYSVFAARFGCGGVKLSEVRRELTAQLERASACGISFTHIDSHQHLHVFPGVLDIVLELAKARGIRAMRIPDEPLLFTGGFSYSLGRFIARAGLTCLAKVARYKAKRRGFAVPDHFFGMLAGGNMRREYLLNIIDSLPGGVSEIMIHPACDGQALQALYNWSYQWEGELEAVTSRQVLDRLAAREIKLITFRELCDG